MVSQPPASPSPNPANVAANVEFLVAHARELERAERDRTGGLDTKAASLVAISGVMLGLTATIGKELGSLTGTPEKVSQASYAVALLALLVAIGAAAWAIWPRSFLTFSLLEIEQYPTREYVSRQSLLVRGTTLRGFVNSVAFARKVNERKGKWLKRAFGSFLIGLAATVVTAITFLWQPEPRMGQTTGAPIRLAFVPDPAQTRTIWERRDRP